MNRLRARKKSFGEASRESSRRPSVDAGDSPPPMPSFPSRSFFRKKQAAPEPKPLLDLTTALPASDDFRTSLLMPKLSARFSMLREQDDPNSKLGKANDDSVLFPKRASRLDLFNNRTNLGDIAEVDSVRGSTARPPFASMRSDSNSSDTPPDNSTMMSRARPNEGNTMFGGRQKVYKIPIGGAGSVKTFNGEEEIAPGGGMAGKPIYESDVTLSTFQQLREQARQQHERELAAQEQGRTSKDQDRSGSPPSVRYNRNRETASSTTSAPSQSRASTAATSVASQKSFYGAHDNFNLLAHTSPTSPMPADKSFIKARRMYGQGIDRELLEQQSSSLQRLGSFSRSRTPVGGPTVHALHQSRSATNLGDRYQRGAHVYSSQGFRGESPARSAAPSRDGDSDDQSYGNPTDSGYGAMSPQSPSLSPELDPHNGSTDATLFAALEPNDVGKATAAGVFNRPKRQYDEQQWLQRQRQLQEGRNTPSPQLTHHRPFSPPTSHGFDHSFTQRSRNNSQGSNFSRTNSNSLRRPWIEDRVPRSVPERDASPAFKSRSGNVSPVADEHAFAGSFKPHSTEVSPMTDEHAFATLKPRSNETVPDGHAFATFKSGSEDVSPMPDEHTFLGGSSSSTQESESDTDATSPISPMSKRSHEHMPTSLGQALDPVERPMQDGIEVKHFDADSPTLGPTVVDNGLSGMVRAHLRSKSDQSSIYPEDSPRRSRRVEVRQSIFGHGSALDYQDTVDEAASYCYDRDRQSMRSQEEEEIPPVPPLSMAARNILHQAQALRNNESSKVGQILGGNDKAQRVLGGEAPRVGAHGHESKPSWSSSLKGRGPGHTRNASKASTETQQEREDLAQELAERRRIVQDKLQTFVEIESRSASPTPQTRTRDPSPGAKGGAFALLKKSSRGSLIGRQDKPGSLRQEKPAKAMKMLGLDSDPNQPPAGLFMGREQFSDRATPPRPRGAMKQQQQKRPPPPGMVDALGVGVPAPPRELFGPPKENVRAPPRESYKRHERAESKASATSHYSEHSEYRPSSRKGDAPKPSGEPPLPSVMGPIGMAYGSPPTKHDSPSSPSSAADGAGPSPVKSAPESSISGRLFPANGAPNSTVRAPPPGTPYMINPSTSKKGSPPSHRAAGQTSSPPMRNHPRAPGSRKQSINKADISEPTFISCTSSVDTIELPPGASLRNGMDEPSPPPSSSSPTNTSHPPIPARDGRRHIFRALSRQGRSETSTPSTRSPTPGGIIPEESSSGFSDDDQHAPAVGSKGKFRLRKMTSEGGNLNARARQAAIMGDKAPSVPQSPVKASGVYEHAGEMQGEHLKWQAQRDVPASAVMF